MSTHNIRFYGEQWKVISRLKSIPTLSLKTFPDSHLTSFGQTYGHFSVLCKHAYTSRKFYTQRTDNFGKNPILVKNKEDFRSLVHIITRVPVLDILSFARANQNEPILFRIRPTLWQGISFSFFGANLRIPVAYGCFFLRSCLQNLKMHY